MHLGTKIERKTQQMHYGKRYAQQKKDYMTKPVNHNRTPHYTHPLIAKLVPLEEATNNKQGPHVPSFMWPTANLDSISFSNLCYCLNSNKVVLFLHICTNPDFSTLGKKPKNLCVLDHTPDHC